MSYSISDSILIPVEPEARGLIFDCDGTLADTVPLHIKAWSGAFKAHGMAYHHQFLIDHMGVPSTQIVLNFNREYGQSLDPESFTADKERRFQELLPQVRPIGPVVDIVRKYQGKLPMSVASGGRAGNVIPTLKAIGLEGVFPVVLTANDPVKPKPNPDLFLEAARRMGVEPRFCQVFEDGKPGIIAAHAAGMMVTNVLDYLPEP